MKRMDCAGTCMLMDRQTYGHSIDRRIVDFWGEGGGGKFLLSVAEILSLSALLWERRPEVCWQTDFEGNLESPCRQVSKIVFVR